MKTRKYLISWNNPTKTKEVLMEEIKNLAKVNYCILGDEKGEKEQTPHIQGYVRFENAIEYNTLHKLLDNGKDKGKGYIQVANGNDLDNKRYCSKQNNFIEYGKINITSDKENIAGIIEDIENGMEYIDLCKKYYYYILYHYRDFKLLYNDIKEYQRRNDNTNTTTLLKEDSVLPF